MSVVVVVVAQLIINKTRVSEAQVNYDELALSYA